MPPTEHPHHGSTPEPSTRQPDRRAERAASDVDRLLSGPLTVDGVLALLRTDAEQRGAELPGDAARLAAQLADDFRRLQFATAAKRFRLLGEEPPRALFVAAGDRALAAGGAVSAFAAYSQVGDVEKLTSLRSHLHHRPDVQRQLEVRIRQLTGAPAPQRSDALRDDQLLDEAVDLERTLGLYEDDTSDLSVDGAASVIAESLSAVPTPDDCRRLLDALTERLRKRNARTGLLAVAAVAARRLNDWSRAGTILSDYGARGKELMGRLLRERDAQEHAAGRTEVDPLRVWDAPPGADGRFI